MSDYPHNLKGDKGRKVYCVTCSEYSDDKAGMDEERPLRVFSALLLAKKFCEGRAARIAGSHGGDWYWENYETLIVWVDDTIGMAYHVRAAEVEDDIPDEFRVPEVEKENKALMAENRQLRKEVSEAAVKIAKALSYATMYDGGYDYAKETVLENLHMVRGILSGKTKEE